MNSLCDKALTARTLSTYETSLRSFQVFCWWLRIHYKGVSRCIVFVFAINIYSYNISCIYVEYTCILTNRCTVSLNRTWQFRCTDCYVGECVKCIQVQESDKEYNREILQTGYISPYMDYLLHAAYVSLNIMGNLQLINRNLPPLLIFVLEIWHLWIHLKASKTDHSDMESTFWNYVLSLYRLCKMFNLKNVPTYPLFLNESGSALSRTKYLFHIKQILHLDLLTGFGLVFPRALISYCSQ